MGRDVTDRLPLTPGKVRGLSATSTREGVFSVLAIDHRDSLRVVLDPSDPEGISASVMTEVKLSLLEGLADQASAVMLEPEYSAAQAIVTRALPGHVGFLAAIEAQGYLGDPAARRTLLLEDWGVEKAKRLGANGIKLLVLYRPDAGSISEAQEGTIAEVVADCAKHDIPLFLEPLLYEGGTNRTLDRRALVVETVRRLGALGPDVLKVQFPLDTDAAPDRAIWLDACAELDDVSPVPWALLSGGGSYERFREQVEIACRAGASGFMVGRALWGDYVTAPLESQPELLRTTVQPRFAELAAIARQHGNDWALRHSLPHADEQWYRSY
jgi:tagatose 1,6-diphosphate aldolase